MNTAVIFMQVDEAAFETLNGEILDSHVVYVDMLKAVAICHLPDSSLMKQRTDRRYDSLFPREWRPGKKSRKCGNIPCES